MAIRPMTAQAQTPAPAPDANSPDIDQIFLRDLVKVSRQKPHHVKWVDRDGVERQTALSQAEVVRLNTIAGRLRISKGELLRRAANVPVERPGRPGGPVHGGGE